MNADLSVVLGMADNRITAAVTAYLNDCRARGLRPATLETYGWALNGATVKGWLAAHGIDTVEQLDRDTLTTLLADLRERGLRPHTVDDYRRTWLAFLHWCKETGRIDDAPKLKRGPTSEEEKAFFTPEEVDALLAACGCERDRVLVNFMVITGLRLKEVIAVDLDDLEKVPGGFCVRVRNDIAKNRRYRRIPLDTPGRKFSSELAEYIRDHRPGPPRGPLWLTTKKGPSGDYERLGRWAVSSIYRRLSKATGVHAHPHKFRHTFATRGLAAGVPVLSMMEAGGWRDPRSMDPYVHARTERLMDDWSRRRD